MSLENVFRDLRQAIQNYNDGSTDFSKVNTPDFNAFEVLYALELPTSRMIGELLNPSGTHLQGNVFLKFFIDQFVHKPGLKKSENIELNLEHRIDNGQIDIFIDFNGMHGIAIENKPYATDQEMQIVRYSDYLKERYGRSNYHMLYLSGDGSGPSEHSLPDEYRKRLGDAFVIVPYNRLRNWILKCSKHAGTQGAERLSVMLSEFAEYIYRIFCGRNSISEEFMQQEIRDNILEAFEIASQWNNNKEVFHQTWVGKINALINIDLPELLSQELTKLGVIDDAWECRSDHFDIRKFHLRGVRLRKRSWSHFTVGVISTAQKKVTGSRIFFPIISSIAKIEPASGAQTTKYNEATGSGPKSNWIGDSGNIFWSANFDDLDYRIWSYEHWSEIKPGGKTVAYLAGYLAKLIEACEQDIDVIEESLK